MAKKTLLVGNDSPSKQLTYDCRIKKRAQDFSWVICKSLFNDLDIKYNIYLHFLIQETKQSNVNEEQ